MTYREFYITECEDMIEEYTGLAKKHSVSVWGQAFYTGVANTLIHVVNTLGGKRSPKLTAKERLLGAIFTDVTPNFLNVNQAQEHFYGSEDAIIDFEANQHKEYLNRFFTWCKKNEKPFTEDSIQDYITDCYYTIDEEEDND